MKILLHSCCAPCLVIPLDDLRSEGHDITTLFYNPNIHPYSEYLRRLDAFTAYTKDKNVPILTLEQLDSMDRWFQQVVFRESQRCRMCFNFRIEMTARLAESKGFDAFSTTLLYSRFQKHDLLKATCEAIAEKYEIPFFYRDWRTSWNEGVRRYRTLGLYRQKYCGCIYSEKERVLKIM
jgi:predicted adenine nucleotide alpha hydrolase (AANH) superfamily ATPase